MIESKLCQRHPQTVQQHGGQSHRQLRPHKEMKQCGKLKKHRVGKAVFALQPLHFQNIRLHIRRIPLGISQCLAVEQQEGDRRCCPQQHGEHRPVDYAVPLRFRPSLFFTPHITSPMPPCLPQSRLLLWCSSDMHPPKSLLALRAASRFAAHRTCIRPEGYRRPALWFCQAYAL